MTRREEVIQGLRELADFLERNPTVPTPYAGVTVDVFPRDREELRQVAAAASWEKVYSTNWFWLQKDFSGGVSLHVDLERDQVCRRVVVGQRTIPAQPAQPEQLVDEVEWMCDDPILEDR